MKKTIKALKFPVVFLFIFSSFIACDKDFSVVESDVLGDKNLNFETDVENLQIAAYNKKLEAVQINGLSSNLLGVYNDLAYGQTTASIITQVTPTTFSPDFGDTPAIDSVVISIPYFSRIDGTENGETTYTILDSLYGKKPNEAIKPFKLTIYQNNYFLNSSGASLGEELKYYSKADGSINTTDNFALNGSSTINFDNHKGAIIKDTIFAPNNEPTRTSVITDGEKVTTLSVPAFRTKLDPAFWKAAIIDKEGDAVLSKADEFNNYFRGLYFKAEAVGADGSMVLLNLASTNANITIYYSKDSTVAGERTQATYVLKFTGNILNTFINDYSSVPLQDGDETLGDETLYLKGTEGSMAVVDLFSGMVECKDENGVISIVPALECFKNTYRKKDSNGNYILKRIINDAQLLVYEDESKLTDVVDDNGNAYHKYDRIYAYDLKNNIPLVDYNYDPTNGNTATPYNSTFFHLGQRKTDDTGAIKYKIHLTEHLNNILLRDSLNTKIGLVLSSNVNLVNNAKIFNSTGDVTKVPATSVITPRGTILHGTNSAVPDNRKMKLKIFFTEPK